MTDAPRACTDTPASLGSNPGPKGSALAREPGPGRALAWQSGAAKSTIMKIVGGQYSAAHGTVLMQGKHLHPGSTHDAVKHGIAIVPQELYSLEDMTVYENL